MVDLKARLHLGLDLARQGKMRAALAVFEEGLQAARHSRQHRWVAYFSRNAALVCDQVDDLVAAERYYRIALKEDPGDPALHQLIGRVYGRMGKPAQSRRNLRKAYNLAVEKHDEELAAALKKEVEDHRPGM